MPKRLLQLRRGFVRQRVRLHFADEQIAQIRNQIGHQFHHVLAGLRCSWSKSSASAVSPRRDFVGEIGHGLFAGESEDVQHVGLRDRLAAKRDQLIEHRFRVAQSAVRAARDGVRRGRLERDLLLSGDELQMFRDQVRRNAMQIETLAAAEDGRQNLLRLGRGEDEFHVLGRFLQRLEQRVERRGSEHVHFVDDVDFEFPLGRRVAHVVAQFAHLLDAVVARAVDFEHVEAVAAGDFLAAVAHAAGRDGRPVHAIERLGQDARGRGFPDAARPDEKIGVREAILLDRILERARDVLLADQIVERLRPIFSREDLIAHAPNLVRRGSGENRF